MTLQFMPPVAVQSAIKSYSEALALTSIGIDHALRGDHGNAIKNYDQALKLDSRDPYVLLNRGASHYARGDNDSAERDLGEALELDPGYVYAYGVRGEVFIRQGDFDRALEDFDRALQLDPGLEPLYAVRGSLYLEKGDLDRAIQDLDKALTLDPNNANAYNDRGVAYERRGDPARAMQDYDRALSIRPNRAAYANRGIALLRLSQWDKARSDLLSARNMGLDIVSVFRAGHGSAAAFEEEHNLELPQDIADMTSIDEAPQAAFTGESILEIFRKSRESFPDAAYDDLPSDGSKNYKHYLYGWPKE